MGRIISEDGMKKKRKRSKPRSVSNRKSPLTPQLKSFIDNAIVPILVKEYLTSDEKKRGDK
jgi:hypothetical protein